MAYQQTIFSLFAPAGGNSRATRKFRVFATLTAAIVATVMLGGQALAARSAETLLPVQPGAQPDLQMPLEAPGNTYQAPDHAPVQLAFSDNITAAIVKQLQQGAAECGRIEREYRIDCLRQVYTRAAGASGNRRDYSAANSELRRLARQLNGIVRQNADRKAPKAKVGSKSYRAITREALRQANRQASQAIQETSTKLLRSAGNSSKRKVHYTRIANAVNSTKKILRS